MRWCHCWRATKSDSSWTRADYSYRHEVPLHHPWKQMSHGRSATDFSWLTSKIHRPSIERKKKGASASREWLRIFSWTYEVPWLNSLFDFFFDEIVHWNIIRSAIDKVESGNDILQNFEDFSMPSWSSFELLSKPSISNPNAKGWSPSKDHSEFICYSQLVIGIPMFSVTFCIGLEIKKDYESRRVDQCFSYAVGKMNFTCGTALGIRAVLNASNQLALDSTIPTRSRGKKKLLKTHPTSPRPCKKISCEGKSSVFLILLRRELLTVAVCWPVGWIIAVSLIALGEE